jgi:hypothetical protein
MYVHAGCLLKILLSPRFSTIACLSETQKRLYTRKWRNWKKKTWPEPTLEAGAIPLFFKIHCYPVRVRIRHFQRAGSPWVYMTDSRLVYRGYDTRGDAL